MVPTVLISLYLGPLSGTPTVPAVIRNVPHCSHLPLLHLGHLSGTPAVVPAVFRNVAHCSHFPLLHLGPLLGTTDVPAVFI
jgi:hypothetical protein